MRATDGSGLRKRQIGFAAVPNDTVWDERLSTRALGLLTKVISLPEDWDLRTDWLVEKSPEGREAVMNTLRELRRAGYYRVERRRRGDGTFVAGVSVSDVSVPEWAAAHAAACQAQNTDKPKWDVSLNLRADGSVEDEPARGPVDENAQVSPANGFTVSGSAASGSARDGQTGDRSTLRQNKETHKETTTPPPTVGPPTEQLALVDPTRPKRAPRQRTALPKDWVPSPELRARTAERYPHVNIDREVEQFHHHHEGIGQRWIDWDRAWWKWLGNCRPAGATGRPGRPAPYRNGNQSAETIQAKWSGYTGRNNP